VTSLLLSILLPIAPPSLHAIPPEARPYVWYVRNEPEMVNWYVAHRGEADLWDAFMCDGSVPSRTRQRAWMIKYKLGL